MDSLLSDFDSHSESSSSDYQEDMESLYGGQARSIFSSLEETIEKIDDFLLFERSYLLGDIVCLVSDPLSKMGKVMNLDMTVDLENIYGTKIRNINSKYLKKIRPVSIADHVVHGAWLGKVEKIVDRLTVLFDDGTRCELSSAGDQEKITVVSHDVIDDPQYPFYPGQRVRIESTGRNSSRSTRWLCGTRKDKQELATICHVDVGFVYVDWLRCADSDGVPAPPCWQEMESLTVLSSLPNWQLGDCCVLPNESNDVISPSFQQIGVLPNKSDDDVSPNCQHIGVIAKTKTKVDVQWQDGSKSLALDSHLLLPVNIVDAHDFWPDGFVLEKGTVDDGQKRWGIVRTVYPKERTVKIEWRTNEEERKNEIVSAYELVEHPDFSFCLGEAVFRVDLSGGGNGGEKNEFVKKRYLSCFGTVVGFGDGDVEVKWANGATSKVAPYEIYRVDKCEGMGLDDEIVQPPNEELPVKSQLLDQKLQDVVGFNNYENSKEWSSASISQVALGFFTSITSSLFGSLSSSMIGGHSFASEGGKIDEKSPEEESSELCNMNLQVEDDLEMPEKMSSPQITEAKEDIMLPSGSKNVENFRQFDMVNDSSDHHFVNESGMNLQSPQVKRRWLKKVQQEWSILEKDLPETIYTRVYEERMDLLRAAIVGSAGTPYHDGLFFFDIYLPPQYPNEPPMVFYNSGGLRLNPNLYESGKVCLSLLNTWAGNQNEVWNPESSTILQVLLSLQALVLNEKPYFNEAGYDSQIGKAEGEKNSVSYNENAFLVSCRSMLYVLRRPPKHFEALVDEHFRRSFRNILLSCKAYMQGAPIGYPFKAEEETEKGTSKGFKIMLKKLYPRIVEAFSDKGIDCTDFSDQV